MVGRRTLSALCTAALVAGLVALAPGTAHAETAAPVLDSVARVGTGTVAGDGEVTVHLAMHDTGGSHVGYWTVTWESETGQRLDLTTPRHDEGADSLEGDGVTTVPHYLASGMYRAVNVTVLDGSTNSAVYGRDGSVRAGTGTVAVEGHSLDLSVLDIEVVNPHGDGIAPTLSDVALESRSVTAGDVAVLTYSAHDEGGSGISAVWAGYWAPGGQGFQLDAPTEPGFAAIGPASAPVPLGLPGGPYALSGVFVQDRAGNMTWYAPEGRVLTVPARLAPQPAAIDLSAVELTIVQPGEADVTAPQLLSVEMLTSSDRHSGEEAWFRVRTRDTQSAIPHVFVTMSDGQGHYETGQLMNCDPLDGYYMWWLKPALQVGERWRIHSVQVDDTAGNRGYYRYNGTGEDQVGHPLTGPVWTSGVTVTAGEFRDDRPVVPECPATSITTDQPVQYAEPGAAVTVSGNVRLGSTAVASPTVAVYRTVAGRTSLVGVTKGSATGRYSRSAVVGSSASFRVRFLGSGRSLLATPGFARPTSVLVGARQRIKVATTAIVLAPGRRPVLSAVLVPRIAGVRLTLWKHRAGRPWAVVTATTTRATGKVTHQVRRPKATTWYRWTASYRTGRLPTSSFPVRVRLR
jgi:hypothetical protein